MSEEILTSIHATWEEAEEKLKLHVSKSATLKPSDSAGARSSSWRNKSLGMTRENHILWIDPEKFPHYQRTYCCVFHKRSKEVPRNELRRIRLSLDKGCQFRAVITTIATRKHVDAELSYNVRLQIFGHPKSDETFVYEDGHNHDTRRTAVARNVLPQNKRLLPGEKDRVRDLGGFGLKPKTILRHLGGADAGDGRTRTPKSISNVLCANRTSLYGSVKNISVDMDLTVKFLVTCGAKFWLYCEKQEGVEIRLSEVDFLSDTGVVSSCTGARFKDLHVLFPGSSHIASTFGDCVSVDSTHNMCSARFPLYLGMVADTNGKGHIITVSLLSKETTNAVRHALLFQKERAGLSHRSILLDKDGSEFSAIASILPESTLVLCRFHAIKYFRMVMAVSYLPLELREAALSEWRNMVLARSGFDFETSWEMLQLLVKNVPPISRSRYPCSPPTIVAYISKNWLPTKQYWVFYLQQLAVTRGTFTTNRNEGKHHVLRNDNIGASTRILQLFQKLRDNILFDMQSARDTCALKLLHDEHPHCINGSLEMPLFPHMSYWYGHVAQNHLLESWKHVLSHSYEVSKAVVEKNVMYQGQNGTWLHFTVFGLLTVSNPRTVSLFCTDAHSIEKYLESEEHVCVFESDSFVSVRCSEDCGEFLNFSRTPCRHVLYVLKLLVNRPNSKSVPVTVRYFTERDLVRPCHEILEKAAQELLSSNMEQVTSLRGGVDSEVGKKPVIVLQQLPKFPSHTAGDAIVAQYMPCLKDAAEYVEAIHCRDSVSKAIAVRICAWSKSLLHTLQATKKPITCAQVTSLWDLTDGTTSDEVILPLLAMKEYARGIAELGDLYGKSPSKQVEGTRVAEWGVTLVTNFIALVFQDSCSNLSEFLQSAVSISYDFIMRAEPSQPVTGSKSSIDEAVRASPAVGLVVIPRGKKRKQTRAAADSSRVERQVNISQAQHSELDKEIIEQILNKQ